MSFAHYQLLNVDNSFHHSSSGMGASCGHVKCRGDRLVARVCFIHDSSHRSSGGTDRNKQHFADKVSPERSNRLFGLRRGSVMTRRKTSTTRSTTPAVGRIGIGSTLPIKVCPERSNRLFGLRRRSIVTREKIRHPFQSQIALGRPGRL
jgi:hypothetical protein